MRNDPLRALERIARREDVRAEAIRRGIASRLGLANLDELRVLDALLVRIELGRERYGHLDLRRARDWEREEQEELLDMRIYQVCAAIAERDRLMSKFDTTDEATSEVREC